ncbi:MAG: GNAT family protein [Bacteroidota bacterium]
MTWIKHPIKLEGKKVILASLEPAAFEALTEAGQEEIIWSFMPVNCVDRGKMLKELDAALTYRESGEQYPFVVIDKSTQKIIGSTRFLRLNEEHKNLEIGYTWYNPQYWGRGYNDECKLLLLQYCFETLKTIRVQITAAEKNSRSRKAILRIGATFEGILRHIVVRNGDKRSAAYYSILEEEWPTVKLNLERLVAERLK